MEKTNADVKNINADAKKINVDAKKFNVFAELEIPNGLICSCLRWNGRHKAQNTQKDLSPPLCILRIFAAMALNLQPSTPN